MGDEDLYLSAANEVDSGQTDPALWAKALALAEGDGEKAKYKYINLRIGQLSGGKTIADSSEPTIKTNKSYPWKAVLIWVLLIFIAGFVGVRPPESVYGNTAIAYKIVFAAIYAFIGGVVIGAFKYFRR